MIRLGILIFSIWIWPSFGLANLCESHDQQLERFIHEKILREELRNLSHRELLELYSSEQLQGRMEIVKEILNTLQPYGEGLAGKSVTERQEYGVARAKTINELKELGMPHSEARKAVDALMGNPSLFQRMTLLMASLDVLMERENAPRWVIRTTGTLALALWITPSITTVIASYNTGYYTPIPMTAKLEAASVLLLGLYGSRGYRLIRNSLSKKSGFMGEENIRAGLNENGTRPWKDIEANFSRKGAIGIEWLLQKTRAIYEQYVYSWGKPVIDPTLNTASSLSKYGKDRVTDLQQFSRALSFDAILLMNIHNHKDVDSLLLNSAKYQPYHYEKNLQP